MESAYQPFSENFRQCCLASCCRLSYEAEQTDNDFEEVEQRYQELYHKLKETLGKNDRLLLDFEELHTEVLTTHNEYIYQQGFQDCIYLLRWLALL